MKATMKNTEKQKLLIISIIAIAVLFFDQLTKIIVTANMQLSQSIPVINKVFHLTYIQNTGASFGILSGSNSLLIWFTIIAIGIIIYFYDAIPKSKSAFVLVALIIGGALSNVLDRLRLGYVVDFLDFRIWPSFNIADAALTVGAIGLIIYLMRHKD